MAYKVTFEAPERELGKENLTFIVKRDGTILGKLKVSKGPLEWVRSGQDPDNPHLINWPDFDEFMKTRRRRRG